MVKRLAVSEGREEFHDNDAAAGGAVADGASVDDGTAAGDGGTAAHSDGNEGGSD